MTQEVLAENRPAFWIPQRLPSGAAYVSGILLWLCQSRALDVPGKRRAPASVRNRMVGTTENSLGSTQALLELNSLDFSQTVQG